nr:unnamed protein product [Callosobruchus analis]
MQKRKEGLQRRREELQKKKANSQKRKTETLLKPTQLKKKKANTVTNFKCNNCEEDMTSDTEINDLKNTGCDECPAWYHLKRTEFAGELYENICNEKFICQTV